VSNLTSPSTPPTDVVSVPRLAPGPRGGFTLGRAMEMKRKGILQLYYDAWKQYGDVVRFQMGPMVMHTVILPEHVQYVLVKNAENYAKDATYDKLRIALGSGLLTAEGPLWQRQRRLMSPTYTPKAVTKFAIIMTDATDQMLSRWREPCHTGVLLPVNTEMMRLTMTVISQSVFGVDVGDSFAETGKALRFILEYASTRTMSFIDPPLWLPTPTNRKLKYSLNTIDNFIYNIIAERRKNPDPDYLLTLLMQARDDETGEFMDEKQVRDEALITFFAGHETTAQLLTWTWYMLAKHPEVEEKLHAELSSVLGGRTPTVDDIPNLTYTRRIIDESLRLYSPVAITARDVVAGDEIGGYQIPAGSMAVIAPYLTHRHPDFWANPEKFDPDHFLPEQVSARPRYAYYPFGAGARICLGIHFALLEAVLVLAETAQHYRLHLPPGQEIHPVMVGTLRPDHELCMLLEAR
jgi:cytochrome P450